MQKRIKNHPRKSQQSSFQVTNNVIQLPDYTDKQKIVTKQGLRIVSTVDNNLFSFTMMAEQGEFLRVLSEISGASATTVPAIVAELVAATSV